MFRGLNRCLYLCLPGPKDISKMSHLILFTIANQKFVYHWPAFIIITVFFVFLEWSKLLFSEMSTLNTEKCGLGKLSLLSSQQRLHFNNYAKRSI